VQYDPPLEEVRVRHHKEFLNTFLGLPIRSVLLSLPLSMTLLLVQSCIIVAIWPEMPGIMAYLVACTRMKGVSDLSERPGFFQSIVDSNTVGIAKVYAAAELLFTQLSDELKKYQVSPLPGSMLAAMQLNVRNMFCAAEVGSLMASSCG
jgi:dynein heavy chain 2